MGCDVSNQQGYNDASMHARIPCYLPCAVTSTQAKLPPGALELNSAYMPAANYQVGGGSCERQAQAGVVVGAGAARRGQQDGVVTLSASRKVLTAAEEGHGCQLNAARDSSEVISCRQ